VTKRRDELVRFQLAAAERRHLLALGKIEVEVEDPATTSTFIRQVQLGASSPKKAEPDQG
jgi:hypothetical protein